MNCKYCNIEFLSNHRNRQYCSITCRNYFHMIKFDLQCEFCKKKYMGRRSQKFCSQTCSAKSRTDHLNKMHIACRKYPKIEGLNRCQIYRIFNQEKGREELHRDNIKRTILIQYLGGKCCRCGYENDIRALQLDHIHGDGNIDRKRKGRCGKIYRYYVKNELTLKEAENTLQVLCANCHAIKTIENNEY